MPFQKSIPIVIFGCLFFKNFQAHSKIYGNAMNSQNYLEKEHILNTYAAWFHVLLESYGNQ